MKTFRFALNLSINGDGTSLWGKSDGVWEITKGKLVGFDDIWELLLGGPETKWFQYTDKRIVQEVNANEELKKIIEDKLKRKVEKITWSECGMQPRKGWSFDVIC